MQICTLTHTHASSYMSNYLLLHSTAESCDAAKCELVPEMITGSQKLPEETTW